MIADPFRPRLHFSPRLGWMNDPNGMIRVDGTYHLFFQHDPDSILHGPMHWGHATSRDLVTWDERPVALYPTDLGAAWSGSAIEAADGEVELFYTAHRKTAEGKDFQVQCLVHSDRALARFELDPANPVVGNPGLVVFRDPKVIWHEPTGRWIMLVTEGQSIGFYGSSDRRSWSLLSSFGERDGRHSSHAWECPDLVPLTAPDGETVWALVVGISGGGYGEGSGTQYFLGAFDGQRFSNLNRPDTELWLDYGRDHYATQSFFDRTGATPVAIGWASNWLYARQTPTHEFRGVMSLPREMHLVETADGLRLSTQVPEAIRARFPVETATGTYRLTARFDLAPGQAATVTLFDEAQPQFVLRRDSAGHGAIRTIRAPHGDMKQFAHDYEVPLHWPAGGLDVEIFVDRGLVELVAADGLVWISNLYFPASPEAPARIESDETRR